LLVAYKIGLMLALGLALIYAFQRFYPESMSFFSNVFPPVIAGTAVVSSGLALRKYGRNLRERFSLIWLGFTLGMLLWFLGETCWAIYALLLNVEIPYPSIADAFWLAGYVPFFIALQQYVKTFASVLSRRILGTIMFSVFASSVLVSAILITPIIGAEQDLVTLLVDFAYPLLDLVLLAAAILGLAIFSKGSLGKSWLLINAGISLDVVADILFSYTTAQGIYYNGHPLELLYHCGYILFTLAFYAHKKEL